VDDVTTESVEPNQHRLLSPAAEAGRHPAQTAAGKPCSLAMLDHGPTDLETAVLDALDEADGTAATPPGTLSLTAARRRHSMAEVLGLIATGPPAI
jgi:hypothetical protein